MRVVRSAHARTGNGLAKGITKRQASGWE